MVPAGNKAKSLSSVNHTTKTIHHHHHHWIADSKENIIQELKEYKQNNNYTTDIVDTAYCPLVKNYIHKALISESKSI